MATLKHVQSRRMYSWWWDSHISPKNSKWLQENLTDMDAKVKQMIKLIEEDADSFARRAEMYYKKRPELMRMVEEFYRAYRALAERYDNATGLIRQAHRTIIDGFPNQVHGDDSPAIGDDADELQKDSSIFQGGKKNEFGGRKEKISFNFVDDDEREQQKEIVNLKESLAKLEDEKAVGLLQYQRSLENLSNLEKEIVHAQEDSKTLKERASKAEAESQALTEDLRKSKLEREACLLQYQQCLDKIAMLEKNLTQLLEQQDDLNERANRAEIQTQAVKDQLSIAETEKEAVLNQKNQLLLKISDLEEKLLQAEENVRKLTEQANKAESEVETQKQSLSKLAKEREAASLQYQSCLETISILERQLSCAQEEAQRLNSEIAEGVLKIKGAEERCLQLDTSNQSLSSELADLMQKLATQDEELTQKQHELGTLLSNVQEERVRFMDVESSFKNLQYLQTQSQEELKSLNVELQQRDKALTQLQIHNNELQVEVQKAKEENLCSTISIKDMQDELGILRDARQKLQEEVEIRVGQRNTLQQEIFGLKEEINGLNNKHQAVIERVDSVGLNVDSFGSAVKALQDDNSKLHKIYDKEKSEKVVLCEKLEKLLEKNAMLENSISGLSEEMQTMRVKVKQLEESCQFYMGEKSVLVAEKLILFSQLQITTENLGKLSEKSAFLENSLVDANGELGRFKEKTKRLEDSCKLLDNEKSVLIIEKESLFSQLQISQQKLEDLMKKYSELEEKYSCLEKEKQSASYEVEELKTSMEVEKQEHAKLSHLSTTRLANLESQLILIQDECEKMEKELEEKLDEAVNAQIEIFILQRSVRDLEVENCEQHMKVKSSVNQINKMWIWMNRVLKALGTDSYHGSDDITDHIICKIDEKECSLSKTLDDNQRLVLENLVLSTLLEQMRLMGEKLETEKYTYYQELKTRAKELLVLQNEHRSLKDENYCISKEVISLSFLSLILKNTVIGKLAETKRLSKNLDQIHGVSGVKEKKLKVMEGNLEMAGVENHRLRELLHQKEVDCLEAEKKFSALLNEHTVLQNLMEHQKCEFDEVKAIRENQEKRIKTLEAKLLSCEEEHEESKFIENTLNYELENLRNEADLWETEGTAFFSEMQISAIYGAIVEAKFHELTETCEKLEDKSIYSSKEIELLKERVGALEDKNEGLEAQLASRILAITSLDRSISYLEKKMKDDGSNLNSHPSTSGELHVPEESIDLQGLETRIKAIEKTLIEAERQAVQEKLNKNWETDSNSGDGSNMRNQTREFSEAGSETLTKDIMLDQISECSPYNRTESIKGDDQMLELWETNNHSGSIDLKVGKSPNIAAPAEPTLYHEIKAVRRLNSRNPSSERFSGKDLSIDKFQNSRRFSETRQDGGNKKSILERLASDAQRLTNLQITVHDLIKMVEITEKNKKGKGNIEFSNVKEQLEESEDAILKLLDINKTLVHKAEEKSATDSDESSYIRKRCISDQARKGSEKIGRLQIEVQKLQFLLLKLDGEKEKNKSKTRVAERRRVLLRDYLYGGMIRPSQRKKKASFCACVRSPTKDD